MSNWADYRVIAVHYGLNTDSIESVKVRADYGDKLGNPETKTKSSVVSMIKNGTTFITDPGKNGYYQKGKNVSVYTYEGTDYLRSDKNETPKDNLENLPTF
jgi:hypothetical protein